MSFIDTPITRSGHAPELPLDPVDFSISGPAPLIDDSIICLDDILYAEDEQLQSAARRGFNHGFACGQRNLRSWCTASMIGGALALFLFAGAFPELAAMVIRQQPYPLVPAALASLNATSR